MRVFLVLNLLFFISCIKSEDPESSAGISSEPWSDEIRALRMELTEMRKEMSDLKERIKQLEDDLKKKPEKCECSLSEITETESEETVQTERKDPKIHIGSIRDLPKDSKPLTRRLLIHPTSSSSSPPRIVPKIAFHADTPKDHSNLAAHHNLIFGHAITNIGNKYHHSTGVFTPDVPGVYVFYVQLVMCANGHSVNTELVVEGVRRTGHFVYSKESCANGGGMTIVHVNAGDSVWVRLSASDGVNAFGWESSFSGFLLYEDQ
ncbi:complement C1q-like protein 4 [Saccostrea cucullata]|uniref:complement C1q-like protein 4 n=1 Tax=Saccostrea cuccullata TaxID=36930 RepID=UPI002ED1EB34